MPDSDYNGWKNYPTWAVNMWLSNDEGLYNETKTRATYANKHDTGAGMFAHDLKRWIADDLAPDLGASFAADLLGYALDQVDWHEIANAWMKDA